MVRNELSITFKTIIIKWLFVIYAGMFAAIENAIPAFIPCLIVTVLDIYSAWDLSKRVHKKYPDRSDGKFKSEYKYRIFKTMIIIFSLLIVAHYVDSYIPIANKLAVPFTVCMFFFYQFWSILENWSSENDNKMAKVFQRIMVNKAERHFGINMPELKTGHCYEFREEMKENCKQNDFIANESIDNNENNNENDKNNGSAT